LKDPQPRRKFLKTATMTTVSAGLALGASGLVLGQKGGRIGPRRDANGDFAIPIKAQREALVYTYGTFAPYVGDIFQAPNALGGLITMTLIRVAVYKVQASTRISTAKAPQPYSFSLTFRAEERLPQFASIHKVSHPALGDFDLFLTHRKADDGGLIYEAVFNHIR
jgi:hypothetical protein